MAEAPRRYRVLYIHGLKGGLGSPKVRLLESNPHFEVRCVQMYWPWLLLPYWIWRQHSEIVSFQPDIVVGSSYGAAILGVLVYLRMWKGPSVFLSQAFTRVLPNTRIWDYHENHFVFLHGKNDAIIPIEQTRRLAQRHVLYEYDDDHRMRTTIEPRAGVNAVRVTPNGATTVVPDVDTRLDVVIANEFVRDGRVLVNGVSGMGYFEKLTRVGWVVFKILFAHTLARWF